MKMKNENLIHIKFEYEEALQSKKDILLSEMNLLKISKTIKNYSSLRLEELDLKLKLFKKIKEINADLGKLQISLPRLKIPEILKKEEDDEEISKVKEIKERPPEGDIEYELQEIQDKLRSISE